MRRPISVTCSIKKKPDVILLHKETNVYLAFSGNTTEKIFMQYIKLSAGKLAKLEEDYYKERTIYLNALRRKVSIDLHDILTCIE